MVSTNIHIASICSVVDCTSNISNTKKTIFNTKDNIVNIVFAVRKERLCINSIIARAILSGLHHNILALLFTIGC